MKKIYTLLILIFCGISGLQSQTSYLIVLDDARLDMGVKMVSVFALDDRAPLSSNPHFTAMWNLVKLGSSLEALLNGMEEPLNDLDMDRTYGRNGYNRSVFEFFIRYGFGESSDLKMQRQYLELAASPGYYTEGKGGTNIHLDYRYSLFNSDAAGGRSVAKDFEYEAYLGGRIGFDWSFQRTEGDAGFFNHLSSEIERIAFENEFTASQLIMLEDFAEDSRVLLPEDVGGNAFHTGPILGGKFSRNIMKHGQFFVQAQAFYDLMDLTNKNGAENVRSQHHISLMLGLSYTVGGEGKQSGATSFF